MSVIYERNDLGGGIFFNSLINAPLKTNTLTVQIISPLKAETAAKTAVLPIYLADTNARYTSEKALNLKLQQLYGSNLSDGTQKLGDAQNIQLSASCINNKYAIDDERVTEELTQILFDCLFNPYLAHGTFDSEIFALKRNELADAILSEINDKRPYAFRRAGRVIFEGEPAALSYQGELEDAEALTPEAAFERYQSLISESVIDISFAGQSAKDAEAVLENVIKPTLMRVKRNVKPFEWFKRSPLKSEPRRVTEYLDVSQSKMVMAFKSALGGNISSAVMALLTAVIGGTPSSKLFLNVREKLSLCYYCAANFNEYKGCLAVDSGVEGENAAKAEAEIIRQIDLTKKGEITDAEIDNAKRQIINSARTINDSPNGMIAWYFARNFAGKTESPEERIAATEKITKDELVEAAKTLELDSVYLLTKEGK